MRLSNNSTREVHREASRIFRDQPKNLKNATAEYF